MNLHEVPCLGNDGHHEGVLQASIGLVHQLEPTGNIHTYIYTPTVQYTYIYLDLDAKMK